MLYPKFLQKGSTIGVPAPSSGAYNELYVNRFKNAKLNLQKMGYNCILSKNIFENNKARSAPAKIRANELNEMFDNEVINFIYKNILLANFKVMDYNKIKHVTLKNMNYIKYWLTITQKHVRIKTY